MVDAHSREGINLHVAAYICTSDNWPLSTPEQLASCVMKGDSKDSERWVCWGCYETPIPASKRASSNATVGVRHIPTINIGLGPSGREVGSDNGGSSDCRKRQRLQGRPHSFGSTPFFFCCQNAAKAYQIDFP